MRYQTGAVIISKSAPLLSPSFARLTTTSPAGETSDERRNAAASAMFEESGPVPVVSQRMREGSCAWADETSHQLMPFSGSGRSRDEEAATRNAPS